MTSVTPVRAGPATRGCVRCQVQINAASGYCTFCGAAQPAPRRGVGRIVAMAGVLAIGAGGVLVVVLGAPTHRGRAAVRLYRSPALATLVPAGWSGGPVRAAPGTTRVVFVDPLGARRRLIVSAERGLPSTSARARIHRLQVLARSAVDYREHRFARVILTGNRPAWILTYDSGGAYHALYVLSACVPSVALSIELRGPRRADVESALAGVPSSVAVPC